MGNFLIVGLLLVGPFLGHAQAEPLKAAETCDATLFKWNKRVVVKALKALYQVGFSVNSKALEKNQEGSARSYLQRVLGVKVKTSVLHWHAVALFGNYPAALEAAGLPVNLIVRHRRNFDLWTPEKIQIALQALAGRGVDMSASSLKKPNRRADRIISMAVGFNTRTRILVEAAAAQFGNLQNALWSAELVVKAIQALHEKGYRPNTKFFKSAHQTKGVLSTLQEAVGFSTDLYTVYSQSQRFFGHDFRQTLIAAKVPVDEIYHVKEGQPWTKELCHRALRALFEFGFKPKVHFLQVSKDERALAVVQQAVGFKTTLNTLLNKTREFHNQKFVDGLRQAGLPMDEILEVKPRLGWTKAYVQAALRVLHEGGFDVKASALQRSTNPEARAVLIRVVDSRLNFRLCIKRPWSSIPVDLKGHFKTLGFRLVRLLARLQVVIWIELAFTKDYVHFLMAVSSRMPRS